MQQPTFHLAAMRASVPTGGALTKLTAIQDQALAQSASGNYLAPIGSNILYSTAGGVNLQRARVNTPSLREVALPYIAPLNQTLAVPSPPNIADWRPVGAVPRPADEVTVEIVHTDAATQVIYALLWFMFQRIEPPVKKEYRTRFTSTIAATAGTWQSGIITLDQVLPAGIYAVVGMDVFGTNLLAARLIFPGAAWRPGVYARNAVNNVPHVMGQSGQLGVYGEFNSTAMPQLEIYAEAANTAQEGYLDLVRTGDYLPSY